MNTGRPLPEPRGALDDATVGFAVTLIDRSGVTEGLESALTRPTGRRRSVPVRAVLVAVLLLALDDRPLHLTAATDLLYRRLSEAWRRTLGIRGEVTDTKSFLAAYRRVRYCFHAILGVVDPSPFPKNRCLPQARIEEAASAADPKEAEAARGRLQVLVNGLLEASVQVLSDDERAAWDGSVGIDATPVALFSKGPSARAGRAASDPDGGWYVREGDHREGEDERGRPRKKLAWALEATIATMARGPGALPAHPNLAVGLTLTRPGEDPGGTATRVLASVRARGHPGGYLGADRAYSSALPGRFHLPVRALGYSLVIDYRIDELGIQANSQGALLVEGTWCCPGTPEALVSATADYRAGAIDEATYAARLAARTDYALRRKEGPDRDGYERFSCPAAGRGPKLICPLRQASDRALGRMKVLDPPADPPKLCRQSAITVAPDVGVRRRQELPFGTEAWRARYATLRNTVEGWNGYLKDPAHEALGSAGRRRVRGIAAQSVFCAFLLVAANVRKIRAHRAMVAEGRVEDVARRARRRRVRLADHLPPPAA